MNVHRQPFAVSLPVTGEPSCALEETTLNLVANCDGGSVRLFLQRVAGGLYVEREQTPRRGTHTCQLLHFSDRVRFEQWCDDDPTRFEHPLLHARLKRDGDGLWRIDC